MPVEQIASNTSSFDLSLVVAIAALVLSVLSPVLSSLITGFFRIKEKKLELKAESDKYRMEFYDQHRAEVIERYLTAAGKVSQNCSRDQLAAFGESMGEIYLYIDDSLWPLLDSIANKIDNEDASAAATELITLCKALSANPVRPKNDKHPQG